MVVSCPCGFPARRFPGSNAGRGLSVGNLHVFLCLFSVVYAHSSKNMFAFLNSPCECLYVYLWPCDPAEDTWAGLIRNTVDGGYMENNKSKVSTNWINGIVKLHALRFRLVKKKNWSDLSWISSTVVWQYHTKHANREQRVWTTSPFPLLLSYTTNLFLFFSWDLVSSMSTSVLSVFHEEIVKSPHLLRWLINLWTYILWISMEVVVMKWFIFKLQHFLFLIQTRTYHCRTSFVEHFKSIWGSIEF